MNCNYVRQQRESKLTRAEERELRKIIQKKFYERLEKSLENMKEFDEKPPQEKENDS